MTLPIDQTIKKITMKLHRNTGSSSSAPVWNIVISVFRFLDKYIALPIQYNAYKDAFQCNRKCFSRWYTLHMAPFRIGSISILLFFTRIFYKLSQQILSPSSNQDLHFGLEGVLLYLIGLFSCIQGISCFWTIEFKLDSLITILNLLFHHSKARPRGCKEIIYLTNT